MTLSFGWYFMCSALAMMGLIVYAIQAKEQFYPALVYLVQSKTSFLLMGNMIIACATLIAKTFKTVFFGSLRGVEVEMLYERAKYSITETCLALTVFRNEITPTILLLFGSLIFVKAFHWLAKSRLEYNEQIQPLPVAAHVRMVSIIAFLVLIDISVARYCVNYTFDEGRSVFILFGFEFGLLVIDIFNLMFRYIINCTDTYLENGLHNKGIALMLIDLLADALRFITYAFFFCLVFVYYGLPIHIVREVWMSFLAFQSKLASFIKYLQLNHNLDQRFDDATEEELTAAGICLICFEPMTTGKKLPHPCGHVFHLSCLRGWFQYRQDCPTCRRDIPLNTTRSTRAVAAARALERQGGDAVVNGDAGEVGDNAGQPSADAAHVDTSTTSDGVGTAAAPSSSSSSSSAVSSSSVESTMKDEPEFPAFYKIRSSQGCEIHIAPSLTSFSTRVLPNQMVVLAVEKHIDESGDWWLHIPDGWIHAGRAEGLTYDAESFVEPFKCEPGRTLETGVSTKKKIERAKAIKKAESYRSILPQPATVNPSAVKNEGSSSLRGRRATSRVFPKSTLDSVYSTHDPILHKLDLLESHLEQMNSSMCAARDMANDLREELMANQKCEAGAVQMSKKILEMSGIFGGTSDVEASSVDMDVDVDVDMDADVSSSAGPRFHRASSGGGGKAAKMTVDEEKEAVAALAGMNEEILRLGEQQPFKGATLNESPSLKQEKEIDEDKEKMEKNVTRKSSVHNDRDVNSNSSPSLREMRAKFFASTSTDSDAGGQS